MLQRNEIPNIYKFTVKQPYKVTQKKIHEYSRFAVEQ